MSKKPKIPFWYSLFCVLILNNVILLVGFCVVLSLFALQSSTHFKLFEIITQTCMERGWARQQRVGVSNLKIIVGPMHNFMAYHFDWRRRTAYHRFMICRSALEGSGRVTEHRNPKFSPSFLDVSTESCSGLSN